ncbi:MAG TPA: glutamate formiminotransferase, partial [Thermoanaerobaculia bacterium]|nr:glutamate formiminotransferase [Thermoanaerobaculia bacterium]
LPVYLYEKVARRPEHTRLADIRRGGFEGLAAKMADPAWTPDLGPARIHPTAGATVIGARFFLIAFNAILDTADVAIAKAIARRVRESGGGLPAVRAMGVYLESRGRAQVSMNLVDFRRTPVLLALDRVRKEAEALGAQVAETELIGLMPEEAATGIVRDALQLPGFAAGRILERLLRSL